MLISTLLRTLLLLLLGLFLYYIILSMSGKLINARLRRRKQSGRHSTNGTGVKRTRVKVLLIYAIFLYLSIIISYLIIKSMI